VGYLQSLGFYVSDNACSFGACIGIFSLHPRRIAIIQLWRVKIGKAAASGSLHNIIAIGPANAGIGAMAACGTGCEGHTSSDYDRALGAFGCLQFAV
jgi:hypothetical protein